MISRIGYQQSFAAALVATFTLSTVATAATKEPDITLTEVVVTAQKREQKLQDIGIAVTAVNNHLLELAGKTDIKALVSVVPSLQINQYSPAQTSFNIRGISQNDFNDSQEGPVAFYNDEVYVSTAGAIAGQTFDLDHVEVLRGPQGTLFGRNATGGLVHVITAKPTKDFESYVTLSGGSHGQFSTEAAISGPFTDRMRGRLSRQSRRRQNQILRCQGPARIRCRQRRAPASQARVLTQRS
jgi:iron complex outermembrane recepter protein